MWGVILKVLGISLSPLTAGFRPCMYLGGTASVGPVHLNLNFSINPWGLVIILAGAGLAAGFSVLAQEGLVRPLLRALFGTWA